MAKNKKPTPGKRAPDYSANRLTFCVIAGAFLITLGVLIFLAAALKLDGDIFRILRQFSQGLAGALAVVLPVIPVWGGVLVLISAQRRPRIRTYLLSSLLLMIVFAISTLMTFGGRFSNDSSLMNAIQMGIRQDGVSEGYASFLSDAYEYGNSQLGSGFLGMLLAWPLWKGFGAIGGGIVAILLAIVVFLFLIRLDVRGIIAGMREKGAANKTQRQQQQVQQREQEMAWQQQQAMQQAMQEQMRMQQMQQQARQQQRVQPASQPQDAPDPWQSMMPAGAANWNQTYAQAQPAPQPQKRQQQQAMQQSFGFQPTPEEEGTYAPPQSAPEGKRKGLFNREQDTAPQPAPRRKGLFAREEEETLPGEAPRPAARQNTAPQQTVQPGFDAPVMAQEEPAEDFAPQPSPYQRPESQPEPAQPAAKPVREGSFMARMQAAQAAKTGSTAPAASRSTHKDTPSAWSQPDAAPAATSWRQEDSSAPARPSARKAKANPKADTAPKKQSAAASWSDTPPWEDSPEYVDVTPPAAPVVPVLNRQAPEGAWHPELNLQPRRTAMADGAMMETEQERPYVYPPMNLLKDPQPQVGINPQEDEIRCRRLESTLQSFKIPAKVRNITHGPAISRFELEIAPGVRVSKVTDLNRNIAMNLEVKSVRIEAPIPGKSLVGVEVPNPERATVTLREVLDSEPMRKATKPLVVALGKDIAGVPILCDLAKMPHLLIAGATGSGKSVCINTIINSLLYRCSPKDVRLIMVDPKVVELQCYNGIPHLLVPVVSDPHKASGALAWAVGEMMDRYHRFQEAGVRAIDGYNESANEEDRMPRIVIIIDELADLMMTCKKDVEERICRLAQLARAAGIHLIVATQRPSVDVITGLIKANIPSRIAFKVSSNVDSRTILDRPGAEQLLGYGDMLYMTTGADEPIRVQGCFLSDNEVNRITDFIRESCPASYDPAILEELEKLQNDADAINIPDASADDDYTGGDGSLLMQAIEMAVNDGQVSTSLIQRRLRLGYSRAGRLVDEMEKRGIVSQKDGAKPRLCLITREEFEMMKDSGILD